MKWRGGSYFQDLTPWIIGVLVVVVAVGVVRQAIKRQSIKREIVAMQQSLDDLRNKNNELAELLTYVKSPAYTEEQARLKFGYAKPGERLAIIPEGLVLGAADAENQESLTSEQSQISVRWKWWDYFFPSPKAAP